MGIWRKLREAFYANRKFVCLCSYCFQTWVYTLKIGTMEWTVLRETDSYVVIFLNRWQMYKQQSCTLGSQMYLGHVTDKDTVWGNYYSLVDDCNITKNNFFFAFMFFPKKLFAIFSIHGLYSNDWSLLSIVSKALWRWKMLGLVVCSKNM